MSVNVYVNDNQVTCANTEQTLLQFLRNEMNLTGTKDGCSRGQCGACMVLLDGKAARACTRKMKLLDGARIETIEGLSRGGKLHPIQIAFLKCHAYQCGFCTPGMIMAVKALLDKNPKPSDEEIKHALRFNICRCTGYQQILDAVNMAADILSGEKITLEDEAGFIGDSPVTKGGIQRVTGAKLFTDDFKIKGAIEGRVMFPKYPHAKILSINPEKAMELDGVLYVATHKDIPGYKYYSQEAYPQQILAIDKVRYIGDPIAVVYAETEEIAYKAMERITVEYEVLPTLSTPEDSMECSDVRIHDGYPNNFFNRHIVKGNVERGFAKSDVIIEQYAETQRVEHGYLELDAALSEIDDQGRIVVYGTGQGPTKIRSDILAALALDDEKLRYVTRPSGGAFGGREDQICHIFAALGTLITQKPARVILNREELGKTTIKRHPIKYRYKAGATKDGKILALQSKVTVDTGAYSSLGDFIVDCTATMGTGPYDIPNIDIDSKGYFTNNPSSGCFRGFGSTQNTFAVETVIDRIAEKCKMDPFEIRRINGLDIGKQTPTGQIIDCSCGLLEALGQVRKQVEKDGRPEPSAPNKKIGFGLAAGFKNMGEGRGVADGAGAKLRLGEKGIIELYTGGVELGQGHDTVVCQVAAETLNVKYQDILLGPVDDDVQLHTTGNTSASRMTYMSGNAVRTASLQFKEKLLQYVAEKNNISADFLDSGPEGVFDCRKEGTFRITYARIRESLDKDKEELSQDYYYLSGECFEPCANANNIDQEMLKYRVHIAYIFAVQAAFVEVDTHTGEVRVLKVYAADDCGRAINPALVKGQIIGSVVMGMGYALSEEYVMKDGFARSNDYRSLGIPAFTHMPAIHPIYIEENHPYGPYGAKGLGEVAANPTAPAITNAIYDAVGVRVDSLPVDQKKLLNAIHTGKYE